MSDDSENNQDSGSTEPRGYDLEPVIVTGLELSDPSAESGESADQEDEESASVKLWLCQLKATSKSETSTLKLSLVTTLFNI